MPRIVSAFPSLVRIVDRRAWLSLTGAPLVA